MSSYDALAAGYDALMTDVGYKKRADWLVRQFRKSGVPVRQVLGPGLRHGDNGVSFGPEGLSGDCHRRF